MAEKLTDFMKTLETGQVPEFTSPQYHYGAKEDSLTFYFRTDESYGHRINNLLTLFLSFEGNELVGCQVKGLGHKLRDQGQFGIDIKRKGKVELGLFFHLLAYEMPEAESRTRLVELGQRAKGLEMNAAELTPAG